jgi:hypothetical protein
LSPEAQEDSPLTFPKGNGLLPDEECTGRGSEALRPVASLFVNAEAFANLAGDERICCGRGMKGRRAAAVLAERYENTMVIRYQIGGATEYAAADRAAIARVTGRKL